MAYIAAYYGDAAGGAIGSLEVTYAGGIRYTDTGSTNGLSTGLDPTGVRPAAGLFPVLPEAGTNKAVSIDQEGIAYLADGSFFISDEYGPCKHTKRTLESYIPDLPPEPCRHLLPEPKRDHRLCHRATPGFPAI
jgi:hypothetical protein